jgi:hypothetical protein
METLRKLALSLLAAAVITPPAWAETPAAEPDFSYFAEQRRAVEAELAGDRFRSMSRFERSRIVRALDRIQALTDGKQGYHELTAKQRAELINEQELINTRLTAARDDSRLVCKRSRPVGSNMIATTCKTVSERRNDMNESSEALEGIQRHRPMPNRNG